MKKTNFLTILLCCPIIVFGQLEVQPDGLVVVNPTTTAVTGQQFTVNSNSAKGVYVNNTNSSTPASSAGIESYCGLNVSPSDYYAAGYSAGIIGKGDILANTVGSAPNYGTFGVIGEGVAGSTYGKNFGVYGYVGLPSFRGGAGILGAANFNDFILFPGTSTRYAGYFIGKVSITDVLTVAGTTYNSDYRYKQNIVELSTQKTFANVLNLNPVEYNFKQRYSDGVDSLGNLTKIGYFDEESPLFQKKHYGLIAQEVQRIYPDLVYEDGEGYLSIDYVGIIPLLIQAFKEQNTTIQ